MQNFWKLFIGSCFVILLMACQSEPKMEEETEDIMEEDAIETRAEAEETIQLSLIYSEEVEIGMATLKETKEGVQIAVEGHHLQEGEHGFHIHEYGICVAPVFEYAR